MNRTFWKEVTKYRLFGGYAGDGVALVTLWKALLSASPSPDTSLISQLLPPWSFAVPENQWTHFQDACVSYSSAMLSPHSCPSSCQTTLCSLLQHHLRAGVPSHWWLRWPQHLGQACHMVRTQQVCQWESEWLSGKVCGRGSWELSCLLFSVPLAISVRQMNLARKGSYLLLIM